MCALTGVDFQSRVRVPMRINTEKYTVCVLRDYLVKVPTMPVPAEHRVWGGRVHPLEVIVRTAYTTAVE